MVQRLFKREEYLEQIRPFVDDADIIKVVTGIRRCGKSCLMETMVDELAERGVEAHNIVIIDLDKRGVRSLRTADQLEAVIEQSTTQANEGYVILSY